jgi:outer membrane protein assembly factor BamE (lipoprotein component of BamABCDE complex)
MAAMAPEQKDVSVLDTGSSRDDVVAALGQPSSVSHVAGKEVDEYSFPHGPYKPGEKRSVVEGLAVIDVVSLGAEEAMWAPLTGLALLFGREQCKEDIYTVTYSSDGKVESVSHQGPKIPNDDMCFSK